MIIRFLACLTLTVLCTGVAAQVVEVRSGEHGDFTRLSIDLPERAEWQVENQNDTATITFSGSSFTFDTSSVFSRISRERIVEFVQGTAKGTLQMKLGCNCELTSFWHGKSLLVFDIREREDVADVVQDAAVPETPQPARYQTSVRASRALFDQRSSLAADLALSDLPPAEAVPVKPVVVTKKPEHDETDAIISKSRDMLVKQLGRAATQGLLSPSTNVSIETASEIAEQEETPPAHEKESTAPPPAPEPDNDPASHINLQAQSSIDRDIAAILSGQSNSIEETGCIDPRLIDVGGWGTDAPFHQQVGVLRVSLMEEFDKINQDASIKLAKLYIYFGFGSEARLVLNMIDRDSEEISTLYALTAIMDIGHAHQGSPLIGQLRCETSAALWSALSYESLPKDIPINTDAVLRAFSSLPLHLRSYLGPVLARRLLDADRRETADSILRILRRKDETVTPNTELVEAEVDIAAGKDSSAVATLNDVSQSNSEPSAEALVKLIDVKLAEGEDISFELAQLAGAYAHENRGNDLEPELIRTYVIALAASGAFDQSYQERERLSQALMTKDKQELDSEMLSQLTAKADDITFLRYALSKYDGEGSGLDANTANAAARRLIDAGFAEQARPFLLTDVVGDAGQDRKLLRAEISLATDLPRQAEVDLLHLTGPDADLLRAQARSAIGDHEDASELYASTDHKALSENEAWLAENWTRVAASGDPAVADMAALLLEATESPLPEDAANGDPVLARNRDLVESSAETRNVVDALLLTKPMPTTTPDLSK